MSGIAEFLLANEPTQPENRESQIKTLSMMPEASKEKREGILPVKYVFLDVVGFTHNRTVETQSDIVRSLNAIVKASIQAHGIPEENQILIPTGDGICVALLNLDCLTEVESPYDAHLRIALDILARLDEYNNSQAQDDDHKFQLRIGVNENVDNIIIDINGRRNVAGDGINTAQRIMSLADGNQILVSSAVFTTLRIRNKYFKSAFKTLPNTTIKHGMELSVHQYVAADKVGLNTELPERFEVPVKPEPRLTQIAAYYFAHAIKNQEFFIKHARSGDEYRALVLIYFLAEDSVEMAQATSIDSVKPHTVNFGSDLESQFKFLESIDFWIVVTLKSLIVEKHLDDFYRYFESDRFGTKNRLFINQKGKDKLKAEWNQIWEEFGLENPAE
jgi:class 3 adenylate cyclase